MTTPTPHRGYLDRTDYLHLASDLSVGETARFNHDSCGDTRQRLYVTRGKDGTNANSVLAYCHNCSLGGRSELNGRLSMGTGHVPKSVVVPAVFTLPEGTTFERKEFSPALIAWLRRYDLDEELPHPWVGYDPRHNAAVLCQWARSGLVAYQSRTFDPDWKGPKYVTRRDKTVDDALPQPHAWGAVVTHDHLVVTEDTLSSVKVAKAGYTGAPLWTAPHNSQSLLELAKSYKDVVVWFDNDNEQVRGNAIRLAKRLRMYNPVVRIVLDLQDPKMYTIQTIQEVVTNHAY